jgi:hypothetical protein
MVKKATVEARRYRFILSGRFPGDADKLNNQSTLSVQNRSSRVTGKASAKCDDFPKFRLGTSDGVHSPKGRSCGEVNKIVDGLSIEEGIIISVQKPATRNLIKSFGARAKTFYGPC